MTTASNNEADADLSTPTIALVGFLGAVVLFICIIALQVAYYQYDGILHAERAAGPSGLAGGPEAYKSAQLDVLATSGPGPAGYEKISIDKAMSLIANGGPDAAKALVPFEPPQAAPAATAPAGTAPAGTAPAATTTPAATVTAAPAATAKPAATPGK